MVKLVTDVCGQTGVCGQNWSLRSAVKKLIKVWTKLVIEVWLKLVIEVWSKLVIEVCGQSGPDERKARRSLVQALPPV